MNEVYLIGNMGSDPESKQLESGSWITKVSIAVNEKFKDKEHTEWINLVFFDPLGETIEKYFQKGDGIIVRGKMRTHQWEDRDSGKQMYRTEVIVDRFWFPPNKSSGGHRQESDEEYENRARRKQPQSRGRDSRDRSERGQNSRERHRATRDHQDPSRGQRQETQGYSTPAGDDFQDDIPF